MIRSVYITGCLGFIGSYITRSILKLGWQVKGIDKMTYAANPKLLEEFNMYTNFSFEKNDIVDLKFIYDCDVVINLAAETHVDNSIVSNDVFIHSNILGVRNVLELIYARRNFKMPILLHFSTDEVYSDIVIGKHCETDILKPSNPYSGSKAAADMLIFAWARTYKVPYVIVRPTNNYGVGQYIEKLIPKTCKYLNNGRKIPLHENGTPIRTWLHAEDTADAIIKIIESGVENEIFNISSDFEQSNINTVKQILQLYYGNDHNILDFVDFKYTRPGQDVRYSIDDSKIRKSLGWKPKCIFSEELPKIVEYYKNNFIW